MNLGLTFLGVLLFISSLFMMMLILVQRGKGGGLTGALGGMGGQSAFGSKAGDLFTRITIVTAVIWITLCMITIAAYNPPPRKTVTKKGLPPSESTENEAAGIGSVPLDEGSTNAADESGSTSDENIDDALSDLLSTDESGDGSNEESKTGSEDGDVEEPTEGTTGETGSADSDSEDAGDTDNSGEEN